MRGDAAVTGVRQQEQQWWQQGSGWDSSGGCGESSVWRRGNGDGVISGGVRKWDGIYGGFGSSSNGGGGSGGTETAGTEKRMRAWKEVCLDRRARKS